LIKLSALSVIYLIWGSIASLNDVLIPYLKNEFELTFSEAMRVQLVFYAAYFFLSIPCGLVVRRFGYRSGILAGLFAAIGGCVLVVTGSYAGSYGFILCAIFVLASGITMLQVSANPYATTLGKEETAPSRLTLVQSFHSLGTTIGPYFGAVLIFSTTLAVINNPLLIPYTLLAVLLACTALLFAKLESESPATKKPSGGLKSLELVRTNPRLLLGALGIFFYVGAEISIGSFLVNYLGQQNIAAFDHGTAGKFVAIYWGCALVGRFAGSALLRCVDPRRLLVIYAIFAMSLVTTSIVSQGWLAMWSILLVGFFNSIMFPTIFALTIGEVRQEAQSASGVLCLGIVGGAVISQLQGILADRIGIQLSFILPVLCYIYIAIYALTALGGKSRSVRRY